MRYAPPVNLTRFAWLSIVTALATIAIKAFAAWLTGSVGLLSDAAESLVNLVAAIFALITLTIAIKPPDDNHPFGHSKAEYFSAAIEGVMIFVAAGFIIIAAVERIMNPQMPEQLGIGLAISVVASILNATVGTILLRASKRYRSATLEADGKHLLTDVVTSVAVLIGVGLVAITKLPIMDPIVALLAGLNIVWTGIGLIRGAVEGLMDIAMPDDLSDRLRAVLKRHQKPGRVDFHAIRTRQAGNRQFMDFHILVPDDWTVKEGHDLTETIIDQLVAEVPDVRVSAHLEPIGDPKSYLDEYDF